MRPFEWARSNETRAYGFRRIFEKWRWTCSLFEERFLTHRQRSYVEGRPSSDELGLFSKSLRVGTSA